MTRTQRRIRSAVRFVTYTALIFPIFVLGSVEFADARTPTPHRISADTYLALLSNQPELACRISTTQTDRL